MDDFHTPRRHGYPGRVPRERHEDLLIGVLQRISLRTWLLLGAALAVLLALALWALVALWQTVGEQAPHWQEKAVGLAAELAPVATPEAIGEPGAAVVDGVVGEAREQVDQYAAELDRVLPGASAQLESAARAWLGAGPEEAAGDQK